MRTPQGAPEEQLPCPGRCETRRFRKTVMSNHAVLQVNLLAGFQVVVGDQSVPAAAWHQKRAAAVVKLLALEPTHRLHREQVLEALWPDLDVEAGARNLRVALHHARHRLTEAGAAPGAFLVRDGESLLLGSREAVWVDVDAFERAAARAWRAADPEAVEAALEWYAGDLLPEDPYEDWAERRRAGLRASYLALLARLASLADQCGDLDRAIAAQQRILAVEPAQEETHAALMRLFASAGRRTQALAQYQRLVAVLEIEVGTAPDRSTRALHEAIRDDRFPERDGSRIPAVGWTNLPAPVDALIGREREVAEVRQLLATARLVTMTGPGGVGKTRLALAVAGDLAAAVPDGICFVDLASIRDPSLVVPAIARALGVSDTGRQPQVEVLAAAVRDKRLLLLLDNFEQVAEAAPSLANLLRACPALKAVVTSRVRLRLRGEQEYPVAPLGLVEQVARASVTDVAQSEAGRLFAGRAREARPDFALTPENAVAVAAICRRLDGLPLAIELAAARAKVLPPASLLARLERRLPLLTGGGHDLPKRQRTMRDAIAWSHDLLSPEEHAQFRRLSVFVGGSTLEAAEAVADLGGDVGVGVLDGLASLVDKSLLREEDGPGGEPRFAMLETIREFALEQLAASGETVEVQRRHAAFYLALAEAADAELTSSQQAVWLDRLEVDRANLRAALGWGLEADATIGLRLAGALGRFWGMRGSVAEGRVHLDALLALPAPTRPAARARALNAAGLLARMQGDSARAEALVDEAVCLWRLLHDRRGLVPALYARAWHAKERNDLELAISRFEECLTLAREGGDRFHIAACLVSLAEIANDQGNAARADALQRDGVALFQELGDIANVGWSTYSLGAMILHRGQPAAALPLLETALAHFHKVDEPRGVAWSLTALAEATWLLAEQQATTTVPVGDVTRAMGSRAAGLYAEALGLAVAFEDKRIIVICLEGLATVAFRWGEAEGTIRLLGAAAALREAVPYPMGPHARGVTERIIAGARLTLDERAFTTAWMAGRALPLSQTVVLAEETAAAIAARPMADQATAGTCGPAALTLGNRPDG